MRMVVGFTRPPERTRVPAEDVLNSISFYRLETDQRENFWTFFLPSFAEGVTQSDSRAPPRKPRGTEPHRRCRRAKALGPLCRSLPPRPASWILGKRRMLHHR